jgi:hypothetical protein
MEELGVGEGVVATLPIQQVAPGLVVDGPAINLREPIFELHRLRKERRDGAKVEV